MICGARGHLRLSRRPLGCCSCGVDKAHSGEPEQEKLQTTYRRIGQVGDVAVGDNPSINFMRVK